MTLILVRHAHRDTTDREADNGLSEKGKKQVKTLTKTIENLHSLENAVFLSSPKKRCLETLEPLASLAHTTVQLDKLLDEKHPNEDAKQFAKRIEQWINRWRKSSSPLTFVCSHGDWLPIAMEMLVAVKTDFKKSGWAELVDSGDKTIIRF
jgi:broad specificity phosphatase PhoE